MQSEKLASLYLFLLLLNPSIGFCHTVTGKVIDEHKEPIPGAFIFLKGTEKHAHTNLFGDFEIEDIEQGDTLIVRFVGFKHQIVAVTDPHTPLLITLEESPVELSELTIVPDIDAINLFTKIDLNITPVNSSQEVLRKVPGLVIGQHAGGGKAEQIFLRGFDIDHGTDITITVDGMPVNMVSHAHGQGYADLHFLIPETIKKIDFGKGPYYANKGNFNTAGYVGFETKDRLENSSLKFHYGDFNTFRATGMLSLLNTEHHAAYIATDYQLSDGPFESPQNFNRINLMGKYTARFDNDDKISLSLSQFTSKWDASGQIPQRLIDDGTITRWGAVDDTEGGNTSRTNVNLGYIKKIDHNSFVKSNVYFSKYDFELYSNFTFFLEDPENSDQIRQKEDRQIFGVNGEWNKSLHKGEGRDVSFNIGMGFRNDRVQGVELSHTKNRQTTLETMQLGDVDETNMYTYASAELEFGKWVINPGLRLDLFNFNYNDYTITDYQTQSAEKGLISPKLNILYNSSTTLQLYLKGGRGFHSNDTRVAVAQNGQQILPAAYGADLGAIWRPIPKLLINTALWTLYLEQEFVYVGDAGIVEPSGKTRRSGVDFGARYQLSKHLFLFTDINIAKARSIEDPEGSNRIPLAPEFTATGGIDLVDFHQFNGGIRFRNLADRPANEDNSIVADGYFIVDANLSYTIKSLTFGIQVRNLFNQEWKEAQFATESRLKDEAAPVEEIHFTPGTPFFIQASITYRF